MIRRRTAFAVPFVVVGVGCRHPAPVEPHADDDDADERTIPARSIDAAPPVAVAPTAVEPAADAITGADVFVELPRSRYLVAKLPPLESETDYQRKCDAGVYSCSPMPRDTGAPEPVVARIRGIAADDAAGGARIRFQRIDHRIGPYNWTADIDGTPCKIVATGAYEVECEAALVAHDIDAVAITVTPTKEYVAGYIDAKCHDINSGWHCNPPQPRWEPAKVTRREVQGSELILTLAHDDSQQLGRRPKCRATKFPDAHCRVIRVSKREAVVGVSGVTPDQIEVAAFELRPE